MPAPHGDDHLIKDLVAELVPQPAQVSYVVVVDGGREFNGSSHLSGVFGCWRFRSSLHCHAAAISPVGSTVANSASSRARALSPRRSPARRRSWRLAQEGSAFLPRRPWRSRLTRWRTSVTIWLASITTWKWSTTIRAPGSARRIPDA